MIRRFARPYAKAIMEVVGSPEKAKALRDELGQFEASRAGSAELTQVLANPSVDAGAKSQLIAAIAKKMSLSDLALRVLEVLTKNHRVNQLSAILSALRDMINAQLAIEVAQVRSAHPLSEAERAKLQAALERRFGKKVEIELRTDPRLLGGFVAQVGSEVYDASIDGQIKRLREVLV